MEIVIESKSRWWLFDPQELWRYRDLFYILAWRDIKVRYKQTVLGVLWVLLQPLVTTFIFTFFFGTFIEIPSGTLPYSVFVLIGLIFWTYFSQALTRASGSLVENQQLVKKVYFPREILPLSSVITAFVDFFVSIILLFIFLLYYGIPINLTFLATSMLAIIVTALASGGLGMLLAAINVTYRDVRYIIPFFLQLLIVVSPVIYPLDIVRPAFRYLLSINPMTGLIDALRSSLSHNAIENPDLLLISVLASIVLFMVGLFYFRYTEQRFADVL